MAIIEIKSKKGNKSNFSKNRLAIKVTKDRNYKYFVLNSELAKKVVNFESVTPMVDDKTLIIYFYLFRDRKEGNFVFNKSKKGNYVAICCSGFFDYFDLAVGKEFDARYNDAKKCITVKFMVNDCEKEKLSDN